MSKSESDRLRVTIVAMTVGFGSAPYVQLLPEALAKFCNATLIAPSHFKDPVMGADIVRFRTGATPQDALRQSLKPWSHVDLIRKIRLARPDVVHILNGHGYPWSLTVATFLPGVPVVTTLHDPMPHPGNRTDAINASLGRYTLSRSAAIHIHDRIFFKEVALRFPGKRIFVVRHPSFASRYLKHHRPGVTRRPTVLFFGRIEHYKGVEILLRAAMRLSPDIGITVAGSGALSDVERQLVKALGNRLTLINRFIEDDEAASLLQRAGVLALPYLQATQSSLPLIAAAFGLPVVASSVGTFVTEVPTLGGVVVAPGDVTALAEGLRRQLDNPRPILNKQETFDDLAPRFVAMYRAVTE